jgi:ATP-binding cassette subfamily F protein 3
MDEPTNHLDIWSCEALERSINEFEGTVLVVSHDRYFLNRVADKLVVLAGGRTRVVDGDYETYVYQTKEGEQSGSSAPKPVPRAEPKAKPAESAPAGEAKSKRKFAYRKAADIEREIAELEAEVVNVEDLLGQPATWRDPVKAVGCRDRHGELKTKLESLYAHWETALEANW